MDTIQLSAVKREIVVFLKSMFQRGLSDLEMVAEILYYCMQVHSHLLSSLARSWTLFYLGAERVKARDRVGLLLCPFQLPEMFMGKC